MVYNVTFLLDEEETVDYENVVRPEKFVLTQKGIREVLNNANR